MSRQDDISKTILNPLAKQGIRIAIEVAAMAIMMPTNLLINHDQA